MLWLRNERSLLELFYKRLISIDFFFVWFGLGMFRAAVLVYGSLIVPVHIVSSRKLMSSKLMSVVELSPKSTVKLLFVPKAANFEKGAGKLSP